MRKFGFKIFSTNLKTAPQLIGECADFAATKSDVFIEIMAHPDSSEDDFIKIKKIVGDTEVRIHAPHDAMGFDAGNKELEHSNKKILALAQKAADIFSAKTIVVHAGCGHGKKFIEETARQFKLFNDSRIVVENLPYIDDGKVDMHGSIAEEIKYIAAESGCGFCLDFSHAICAALSLNIDVDTQLKNFFALKPTVYHMCDGYINKPEDLHLHFGAGNYPLQHFLNDFTHEDAYITMETGSATQHNDLWIKDYNYLKSLQLSCAD